MAKLQYSLKVEDENTAKAMIREAKISRKYAVELCRELKGKSIEKARRYVEEIIAMKRALPLRKHNKGVAHRRGLQKACAGRYPKKTAEVFLKLLNYVEANAINKGIDLERARITHISAKKGRTMLNYIPRAYGRATPHRRETVNLEIIVSE